MQGAVSSLLFYIPHFHRTISFAMPTSTLKISILLEIIPVSGAVSRIHLLCVRIPSVPAGPDVPVCSEEIMMMVDQTPVRCYPGSVLILPPPAMCVILPARSDGLSLFLWPRLHELLRGLVMFLYPTGTATPVRELEVRFICDGFPISTPFETKCYSDLPDFREKSIFIIIRTMPISPVNIKGCAPLMIAAIAATLCIRDDLTRLRSPLCVQGILLCSRPECFSNFNL